MDIFGNGVE
jgi:hypothetical protein